MNTQIKRLLRFPTSSNLAFLIPLILAAMNQMLGMSLIVGAVFVMSSLYHYHKERRYRLVDNALAYSLMGSNLLISIQAGFQGAFFYVGLAFIFSALYIYWQQIHHRSEYHFYHGLWHIASAFGTAFFILAHY